jgi:putative RNA 2'-phosphotransferase
MNDKRKTTISKFLSKYLRHEPEALGLTLAAGGWVPVYELLAATAKHGFPITRADLDEVVKTSDKQRFSFDESATLIRANQGHSAEVDLQLEPANPPALLFHGTAKHSVDAILATGLNKMNRHHVHLSLDVDTARKVAMRHGKPVIFHVDAGRMLQDGYTFFMSANGVWLTDAVPASYLRLVPEDNA